MPTCSMHLHAYMYPLFTRAPRSGSYPDFGVHTGTFIRIRSGSKPGSPILLLSRILIRVHDPLTSYADRKCEKKWRKKASGGAIARQSCSWSFGAKTEFIDSCQDAARNDAIFRKIAQDLAKSGYERFEPKVLKKKYKDIPDRSRRSGAGHELDEEEDMPVNFPR